MPGPRARGDTPRTRRSASTMRRAMRSSTRAIVFVGALAASSLVTVACATDNGANVFGPQFTTPPGARDADADGADAGESDATPNDDAGADADAEAGPP